jgi:pimeloyl-ACP methyl ester carboxylesterase
VKKLSTITLSGLISAGAATGTWLSGPDPHHPITGLPGAADWPAAVRAGAPGSAVPDLSSLPPAQAERFFARLSPAARAELTRRAPGVVGNLDGAPYRLRYAANELAARADAAPTTSTAPTASTAHTAHAADTAATAATADSTQATNGADAAATTAPGRLLAYDPRGDGKIVEVFGDLATARQVVVLVPGSGWTLPKLLAGRGGGQADPVSGARALLAEIRAQAPAAQVAVVVWLGYDAPENIDRQAARSERAITGARALTRFLAGLPGRCRVILVGHSYGTVVAGRAAAHSPRVTDVVALASPGMDAGSVAGLHTRARVWAARTAGDPIAYVPHVHFWRYGHGGDPVAPGYGALVFRTGATHGHGGYYAPGGESLINLARIALGRTSEVTLVGHAG